MYSVNVIYLLSNNKKLIATLLLCPYPLVFMYVGVWVGVYILQMEFNTLSVNEMSSRVLGMMGEIVRTMGEISAKFVSQTKHLLSKDDIILFVNVID